MLWFDLLKGIAKYELEVENAEKFLNGIKKDVTVKDLVLTDGNKLKMACFYREAGVLESRLSSNGGRVIKRKNVGLPVLAARVKHRAGLLTGMALSVVIIMLSTLFVWEIRIEGNETLSDTAVIEMLERAGFREGMIKRKVNVKKVTDRLLINEDEVSWMAINFDGTVAHVEMKEAKIARPYPKKENVNLVASTNGIILRVDALEGGTKVSKGEAVTKGQLLVSAFVDKRTGGSMLRGARGFVWANTKRNFCVVVPLEYTKKKYTYRYDAEYSITFLGKTVKLANPFNKQLSRTEFFKNSRKLKVFEKTVLPVTLTTYKCREFCSYISKRSTESALETARKTANERLFETSPDFKIADTVEEFTIEDGRLIYKCTFDGVENIAKELEFELS